MPSDVINASLVFAADVDWSFALLSMEEILSINYWYVNYWIIGHNIFW